MRLFKLSSLAIAAILAIGFSGNALAFHDGGVAQCDGCHTMHNSYNGLTMSDPNAAAVLVGNTYLLQGSDASSTCLNCHGKGATIGTYQVDTDAAGYTGTTVPQQMTPGGDFAWLKASLVSGVVTAADEATNRHGHHIVASDYGFQAATMNGGVAPGGTYVAGNLGCNSCHNPHNNLTLGNTGLPISISGSYGQTPVLGTAAGVYRFLGGVGYGIPDGSNGTYKPFAVGPPAAVAPLSYNQADGSTANQVRVAYGSGMSEWCANCHAGIQNLLSTANTTTHRHVAGNAALLSTPAPLGEVPSDIYKGYVNSGQTSKGGTDTAYLALVPYEMHTADTSIMGPATASTSASSADSGNVMCLSCHRAHASGFDSMTRWDNAVTFITTTDVGYNAAGNANSAPVADTTGYLQAAYNGMPALTFGPSQRSLCNKCHARD